MVHPPSCIPLIAWMLAAAGAAGPAGATVWHADPGIAGSLQGTADLAAAGDTVLLAPGTYAEHVAIANKFLVLLGEDGAESTILDGGHAGRILAVQNSGGRVHVAGVTFRNGALAGLEASDGAAIAAWNSPLRLVNCVFTGNRLLTPGRGGAIFTSAHPLLAAPSPGSIPPPVVSDLIVEACTFQGNSSGDEGGAVFTDDVSSSFLSCDFIGNTAVQGGAVSLLGNQHRFTACAFEDNQAALHGGAMYSSGTTEVTLADVLFRGNIADDYGGALRSVSGGTFRLLSVWFVDNGALRGPGLDATGTGVIAERTLFYGGIASQQAGGVYLEETTADFTRCSWLANSAPYGASLVVRATDLTVTSSLLGDDDPHASECLAQSTVTASCNAGAPTAGECVEVAARVTVAACPSNPEALCALPEVAGCGVVGHADVTCPPGACATPVLPTTWGKLKTAYR